MPCKPTLLLGAALWAAAGAAPFPQITLGTLDGKSGLSIVSLNSFMTLAYDSQGLWRAWQGDAQGPVFHTRREDRPWTASKDGKPVAVEAASQKAIMEEGLPKIVYALKVGAAAVRVEEYPQFDDHYGAKALFRYFVISGLPEGVTLKLDLRGRPPREGEKPKFTETGQDSLVQKGDGKTRVKISWPELEWGAGW